MTSTASIQGNTKGSTTGISFKKQLCRSPERWPDFHELLPPNAHLINTFRDEKVKQPETDSPLRLTSSLRYHASQPILTYTRSACSAGKLLTPARWPHGAQLAPLSPLRHFESKGGTCLSSHRSSLPKSGKLSFENLWQFLQIENHIFSYIVLFPVMGSWYNLVFSVTHPSSC